jgi:hypothetical protein
VWLVADKLERVGFGLGVRIRLAFSIWGSTSDESDADDRAEERMSSVDRTSWNA